METYLTLKYRKFCFEYLKCKDKGEAAVKSGFTKQMGGTLLKKTVIKLYLRHLMAELEQQQIVNMAWKLDKLKQVVEDSLGTEDSPAKARQNEYSSIDPKSAIAAIAEMNKMQGDYKPTQIENKMMFDPGKVKDLVSENEQNLFKKEF